MGGSCGTHGTGNEDTALAAKHEGKRRLGRPRCRWDDNSKAALIKILGEFRLHVCKSACGKSRALVNTVFSFRIS